MNTLAIYSPNVVSLPGFSIFTTTKPSNIIASISGAETEVGCMDSKQVKRSAFDPKWRSPPSDNAGG
jgi:hypothetical protein